MLTITNVSCQRGYKRLFEPVSFSLRLGQALHLEGDNGVGKTSLLRIICGLSPADSGELLWNGNPLNKHHPEVITDFRASLCYVGHNLSLKDDLTAIENLLLDAQVAGNKLSYHSAIAALQKIGLHKQASLPLKVLSQGQKRRMALARLFITHAKLWVLDEPFVALDTPSLENLRLLLLQHVQQDGMLIFTSHQSVKLFLPHEHAIDVQNLRMAAAL